MPEPYEVILVGVPGIYGYACYHCKSLYPVCGIRTAEEAKVEAASHCVGLCRICDKETGQPRKSVCDECADKHLAEQEAKKFAAAEKLAAEDYNGPVYWEGFTGSYGDDYFADPGEVLEECNDNDLPLPQYAWACSEVKFSLGSADDFIDSTLEYQEMHEGAGDSISAASRKELQDFMDAWTAKQAVVSWMVDYTRAVVF